MAVALGLLAAALNLIVCFFMIHVERKLLRDGELPQRGILRIRDYNFFMLGDLVCVTIMDAAILYILTRGWPLSLGAVNISIVAAFTWTVLWHIAWFMLLSSSHRWNSFCPRPGMISLLGKIHLVYFFVQYALGFMGLWMIGYMAAGYRPWLGWVVPLGLLAAGAYFITLGLDCVRGKFRRLFVQRG